MQPANPTSEAFALPALRSDLQIEKLQEEQSGWMIIDPLRQAYFRITRPVFEILAVWKAGSSEDVKAAFAKRYGQAISDNLLGEVFDFLTTNELTREPKHAGWRHFAGLAKSREKSIWSSTLHGYLFFRIPLCRPQVFLDAAWPYVGWLFTKGFFRIICALAIISFWLVARQWDVFVSTFAGFLTLEGLATYSAVLVLVKIIHELGHAFMAKKYGAHVSTLGVAFIVLFPILYTDTTAAWRLNRRKRLLIDAGGILAELSLAVIATLLWIFLPDGLLRSLAFVVATISWVLSLAVNLNPLMRFDGYYLLSDGIGVENLQERGFALARWKMRETLFGFGEKAPEAMSKGMARGLILHAYATWIYRFFLFLGIALIVYHMFFKLAGIALFVVEIVWFIGLPIWRELKQWYTRRAAMKLNFQSIRMIGFILLFLAVLIVPWQQSVVVPGVLTAAKIEQIFPKGAGRIVEHLLTDDRRVKVGDTLMVLADDELDARRRIVQTNIALLKTRLARTAADTQYRSFRTVLEQELRSREQELVSLEKQMRDLIVLAPVDGVLTNVMAALEVGDYVAPETRLAIIKAGSEGAVRGFVDSDSVGRLKKGSTAYFVPEEPEAKNAKLTLVDLAPVLQSDPLIKKQFDIYGGAIVTSPDPATNEMKPRSPVYLASFGAEAPLEAPRQEMRGTLHIDAERESLGERILRQFVGVLIRESGF